MVSFMLRFLPQFLKERGEMGQMKQLLYLQLTQLIIIL